MTTLFAAVPLTAATLGFLTIRELREISVTSTKINCLTLHHCAALTLGGVYIRQVTSQYNISLGETWKNSICSSAGCMCRACFYFHWRRNGPFFGYINRLISLLTKNLDVIFYRPSVTQGKPVSEIPTLKVSMTACQGFGAV